MTTITREQIEEAAHKIDAFGPGNINDKHLAVLPEIVTSMKDVANRMNFEIPRQSPMFDSLASIIDFADRLKFRNSRPSFEMEPAGHMDYFLRLPFKIKTTHVRKNGEPQSGYGSGFFLSFDYGDLCSSIWKNINKLYERLNKPLGHASKAIVGVTCRHVVDYGYNKDHTCNKNMGWALESIEIKQIKGSYDTLSKIERDQNLSVLVPKNPKIDLAVFAWNCDTLPLPAGDVKGKTAVLPYRSLRAPNPTADTYYGYHETMTFGMRAYETMAWHTDVAFIEFKTTGHIGDEWTYDTPIKKTGTQSSDPQREFRFYRNEKEQIQLLEAKSYGGCSGSPVIACPVGHPIHDSMSRGKIRYEYRLPHVAGIIQGHYEENSTNSGLAYYHTLQALDDFLNGETEPLEVEKASDGLKP